MDETSREEMKRLRERALAAHAADPYTVVSVHFLIKLMDALLDEEVERPLPSEVPSSGVARWGVVGL